MPRTATALRASTCLTHHWELGEDITPHVSKIPGVIIAFAYSVHCPTCGERTVKKSHELCPYCFTDMEHKRVDTEVSRFKHHPDPNLDPHHYATIHTCPTCTFRCVTFTYDR